MKNCIVLISILQRCKLCQSADFIVDQRGRKRNYTYLSDELHRVIIYFTAEQTKLICWFHCWSAGRGRKINYNRLSENCIGLLYIWQRNKLCNSYDFIVDQQGRKRNYNHLNDELHRAIFYFTAGLTMLISWFHCWSADALLTIPFPFLMSVYRVRSVAPFPRGVVPFSATLYFMISVSQRLCFAPRGYGGEGGRDLDAIGYQLWRRWSAAGISR